MKKIWTWLDQAYIDGFYPDEPADRKVDKPSIKTWQPMKADERKMEYRRRLQRSLKK